MNEMISVSTPFLFALLIQFSNQWLGMFVERAIKTTLPEGVNPPSDVKLLASDVSTYVYLQLTFFFGILLSAVSCIAITLTSPNPIVAILGAVVILATLVVWVMKWQGLNAIALQGGEGKWMRLWGSVSICLQWLVAIYARSSSIFGP